MKLHIVVYEPAIIQNVGNIARTCYAFNAQLHLIRPYGFLFNKSKLKRASTNHFDLIELNQYDNWEDFESKNSQNSVFFLYSRWGNKSPDEVDINKLVKNNKDLNIYLVFGNEQKGIDVDILHKYEKNMIRVPINQELICLNVANTVSIACYEVVRQLGFPALYKKGK